MPWRSLSRPARESLAVALGAMRPPPEHDYNSWAETERHVAVGTSANPGRWRSHPYQRDVLALASDPKAEGMVFVACSQGGGKTEIALNIAGFHIDADPAPILFVEPTLNMAEALSKDRLSKMIQASPALADRISPARSRDSENTLRHKVFPGGHITLVGANSASDLAMRPIRVLVCDEVDRYPPSAGSEGDPVGLAEARTTSFWNAKKFYVTSPGNRGTSRSEVLWERSDRHEYFVPCPDCGEAQVLKWSQVQWERDEEGHHRPDTAVYVCEHCGSCWDDVTRWRASGKGEMRPTAPFTTMHGARMGALGVIGRKLSGIVEKWLEAQGKPELLKVFVNTVLSEWWEEKYHTVSEEGVRREPYPMLADVRLAPMGVAVLTAAVDVQDDRLEMEVHGWGRGEEWWILHHHDLHGDPSTDALWASLWEHLCRPIAMERGGHDFIRSTCVDTGGHYTQRAYDFVRPRTRTMTADGRLAYVFGIKGQGGSGELWPKKPSMTNIGKIPLYPIKVDAGKELVYARLQRVVEAGPGYIHIPDAPEFGDAWAAQLTAEKVVERTDKRGFPVRVWEKKASGRRNEALDLAVMNVAALEGLRSMGFDLDAEADDVATRTTYVAQESSPLVVPGSPAPEETRTRRERRRDQWIESREDWLR